MLQTFRKLPGHAVAEGAQAFLPALRHDDGLGPRRGHHHLGDVPIPRHRGAPRDATEFNVIVCGETGVGKELVVTQLVQKSPRRGKPYVKVNCAALPDTLLESEMFGYERGAFTGAIRTRRGKFEQAHGGVLFLDEIGDMSLPLQSKLLHVLQGGDFSPLGSEKQVQTDVWVIAATNRNLAADVERGNFRDDLYYRLSTITITIQPLRNRPEDIPALLDYYIRKFSAELGRKEKTVLSQEAFTRLCAYPWPGNVRELQNVLQRIIVLGESEDALEGMLISSAHLQPHAPGPRTPASTRASVWPKCSPKARARAKPRTWR